MVIIDSLSYRSRTKSRSNKYEHYKFNDKILSDNATTALQKTLMFQRSKQALAHSLIIFLCITNICKDLS